MNNRLYHMNYNNSKQQIRFFVATKRGRSYGKMKQEMDNATMYEGENLTYMLVSRSLPIRMDQHGMKRYQRKCLQIPVYKTNNTHPEVNMSNIETFGNTLCYGIQNLKTRNPKSTICKNCHTDLWLMHSTSPGRAHC
jgi:hypothetical protein